MSGKNQLLFTESNNGGAFVVCFGLFGYRLVSSVIIWVIGWPFI